MTINKHGLKINGLKKASGDTVDWGYTGWHTQICYDTDTGDIYTHDHCGQSWTRYHDPEVITVCHTTKHMTMQDIADAIFRAVQLGDY